MKTLKVASVQFQHAPGDKTRNLQIMRRFVEQAARESVKLICFPECCVSGYWHLRHLAESDLRELAEKIPDGPTTEELQKWSREFDMSIGAGFVEVADDGRLYNSYVVAMPDGNWARHRKMHVFISKYMHSGSEYTVFDLPDGWRVAVLICYDNNLIENARTCALLGAEIVLAPHQTGGCNSGSPFAMGVIDRTIWDRRKEEPVAIQAELCGDKGRGWLMRWLPARAHDNGMFYIFSNGVGPDDDEVRTGNAMILDPYGRIIVETCKAGDDMIIAELDATLRERCTGVRWMRARRPELYQKLVERTGKEQDTRLVRFDHLLPKE